MDSGVCFVAGAGLLGAAAGESAIFSSILHLTNCRATFRGVGHWELPNYLKCFPCRDLPDRRGRMG
ncbi:hypothetical protein QBC36DRAFT_327924 [Triangularia setosa]|uniref:Uncharacterized protein n=1 Tax=Triangularia setosa TaxID=2587417 RepID=A0AAN7A8B1_9PEZI|nr:hypothetical protein QBC36DRAFT_327924 [Podospora setosa]